ncbi:hypothetical protein [Streptomyces carpinensis]|uniref:Uncharacterized protein n=1 Tax=Streptomyces carpinensis TaxID=66369 RepID=A0ABV1W4D7_9ACTN|nr:hypothetical protein [Streptomyces carpinensis]
MRVSLDGVLGPLDVALTAGGTVSATAGTRRTRESVCGACAVVTGAAW